MKMDPFEKIVNQIRGFFFWRSRFGRPLTDAVLYGAKSWCQLIFSVLRLYVLELF